MIGNSRFEYFYIKFFIIVLHSVAPLCLLYCVGFITLYGPSAIFTSPFSYYPLAESLFFLAYFPYRSYLQRDAIHPPSTDREERKALVSLCHQNVPNFESYIRQWFHGAELADIKRDNIKEFILWAFFNRGGPAGDDAEEVDEYIDDLEIRLGRRIEEGKGNAIPFRLTLDRVDMLHRSIFWRKSPLKSAAYWYREHKSKDKLPIVFLHGIGIGLYPYTKFLKELNPADSDDQIGILAIENLHISFRLTHAPPTSKEVCIQIERILLHHFDANQEFVFVAHSFGTNVVSLLLKNPSTAKRIKSIVLIDPIPILLHLPTVAYNFTKKVPLQANEHQLSYFASKDIGVAHTLGRHFFWSEVVLWKKTLNNRNVTASLSGRDLIVNTEAVGRYLSSGYTSDSLIRSSDSGYASPEDKKDSSEFKNTTEGSRVRLRKLEESLSVKTDKCDKWKYRPWKGTGIDILWFEELDHAQVFDKPATRKKLKDAIHYYCNQSQSNAR